VRGGTIVYEEPTWLGAATTLYRFDLWLNVAFLLVLFLLASHSADGWDIGGFFEDQFADYTSTPKTALLDVLVSIYDLYILDMS